MYDVEFSFIWDLTLVDSSKEKQFCEELTPRTKKYTLPAVKLVFLFSTILTIITNIKSSRNPRIAILKVTVLSA